jgi:sporulation protein YlmC with PRC-barrel domain
MLRSARGLYGYTIAAKDGHIGSVHDFFFDGKTWVLKYLVVDTGKWLLNRKVLIGPDKLGTPDWDNRAFPVALTTKEIEEGPGVATAQPIDRQVEEPQDVPTRWIAYWSTPDTGIQPYPIPIMLPELLGAKKQKVDPNLRSMHEIFGYKIEATDGHIGHVEDFILDDVKWTVELVIIDTRNWLPGRKVMLAVEWITNISWSDSKVCVDLKKETIKGSPTYDPSEPVNEEFKGKLFDYYGRPRT